MRVCPRRRGAGFEDRRRQHEMARRTQRAEQPAEIAALRSLGGVRPEASTYVVPYCSALISQVARSSRFATCTFKLRITAAYTRGDVFSS